ncbi:penicillin-binding protein 1A, partial [Pseudomonas aeruginosa MPAO1/P2]
MRRTPIRFADIPQDFIHALLSAEDDNFANHYGVDVKSLMRAAAQLLKSGHIQTGGSTITMQVAKNYFLTNERSFSRKINEILLALQIERQLTKDEILELYVNKGVGQGADHLEGLDVEAFQELLDPRLVGLDHRFAVQPDAVTLLGLDR